MIDSVTPMDFIPPRGEGIFAFEDTYECGCICGGLPTTVTTNSPALTGIFRTTVGEIVSRIPRKPELRVLVFLKDFQTVGKLNDPYAYLQDDRFVIQMQPSLGRFQDVLAFIATDHAQKVDYITRPFLERLVTFALLRHPRVYALHGAVVGTNRGSALLVGDRGAGKSTLAYACVRNGMSYTTDDLATRHLGVSDVKVHGYRSRVIYLDSRLTEIFPELLSQRPATTILPKMRIHLDTLFPKAIAPEALLRSVILLGRHQRSKPILRDTSVQVAFQAVKGDIQAYRSESEKPLIATIRSSTKALLMNLPLYRLTLGHDIIANARMVQNICEGQGVL